MSILQFLRILWAYRFLTLATTTATVIGAIVAILIIPPSYEAKTRVILNILKPDPLTGEAIPSTGTRTYIATQIELIKDLGVAGQAVDRLGWVSNPETLETYGATAGGDDLRRTLGQRIIDRTRVSVPPNTNMLEIGFRSTSPEDARMMANALREAYIETTLNSRRQEATRNSDWFVQQAEKEKAQLIEADAAKTAFEKANGIVMQDEKTDIETARLRALSSQSSLGAPMMQAAPTGSQSSIQLATLDSQIAQVAKTYGPNHPAMIQLRAQRETLAKVVEQDRAGAAASVAATTQAMQASAGALKSAVQEQTTRVLANREKIERLTQLQAEVNLHRGQMEKALERAAELRQQAAVADSGITMLSEAVTPRAPSFPDKPLILGGGFALGAGVGLLLSLLLEFIGRKVRGPEDLAHGVDAPLLAVISPGGSRRQPHTIVANLRRVLPGRRRTVVNA